MKLAVLALLAAAALAGCRAPTRDERPLKLTVTTVPAGAAVSIAAGGADARQLGRGPVAIDGLLLVRKVFLSGERSYWLRDPDRALPANPAKPPFASPLYAAGDDYPLDLAFTATEEGYGPATAHLRLDREALERLYREPARPIDVQIQLPPRPAAAPPAARPAAPPTR